SVPHPLAMPPGCRFAPRCKYADSHCQAEHPPLTELEPNHSIRCFHPNKEERSGGDSHGS
ncbi:MAG: methionine ABC transporter ATP-binding protein, partial [Treponema sp.]|nr:methionine ABC transporter ATP-binding protein [Treponema sp.]